MNRNSILAMFILISIIGFVSAERVDVTIPLSNHTANINLGWNESGHYINNNMDLNNYSIVNATNINASQGFFTFIGSSLVRIIKGWFIDLDVSRNVTIGGNLTVADTIQTKNLNVTGDMEVDGNATFTGPFYTNGFHTEGNDTYFHGAGVFNGNVTAPNIEVMESLIVHGNSSCTGTATACSDALFVGNPALCGWTTTTGQRGCWWRWWTGDCVGTATPCSEMSTSTCELQHVCTLVEGSAGFIVDGSGLVGDFNINTTGNITANNFILRRNGTISRDDQTTKIWIDDTGNINFYLGS